MKVFKMLQILTAAASLWMATGCSEEIMSPVALDSSSVEITSPALSEDLPVNTYHVVISLKPRRSYSFDFSNTGLYTFNSVSVIHPESSRKLFEIVGYMDDEVLLLNNHSSGFLVKSISIENLTSRILELTVVVKGSDVPVRDPYPGISKNQQ